MLNEFIGARELNLSVEDKNIEVIRSKRKTVSLEIKPDLRIIVRAPLSMRNRDVTAFVESKRVWLKNNLEKLEKRALQTAETEIFTSAEIREMTEKAKTVIAEKAAYYADIIGVEYEKITIRHQVSRWGSCSPKRNLSFNCLLMLCPEKVTDYVVVHELCHLKEMNHSESFWAEVGKVLPDYKERRRWLRENGNALIARLGSQKF